MNEVGAEINERKERHQARGSRTKQEEADDEELLREWTRLKSVLAKLKSSRSKTRRHMRECADRRAQWAQEGSSGTTEYALS